MAKTLEQIQQEFNAITLATRQAYDKLEKIKTYDQTSSTYKQVEKAYKDAQEKKDLLGKELAAAKKIEDNKSTKKSSNTAYSKALADLKKAELAIEGYQGTEKYQDAYRKVEKAYKDAIASGVNLLPIPAPKIAVPVIKDPSKVAEDSNVNMEEFTNKITNSGQYIAQLSDAGRKDLAIQLNKVYGLKLPVNGSYSAELKSAYQTALNDNLQRSIDFNRTIPFAEFLVISDKEGTYKDTGGSSGLGKLPEPSANILNNTEAASIISNSFDSLLLREATPKEIAKLTKELITALRDPKNAQRATRNKNGVIEYSGGIKPDQWVAEKIKALPEYVSKIQAKQDLVSQGIETTARANGLKLLPEEIKVYSDRIKNGEDIKTIENQIRSIASLGQPDSIKKLMQDGTDLETLYSPYKRIMATSLGINVNSINLDDPTLRLAIGPDKEMSIYDYQKAIRTDNRWKYSQEANDEVTNMINQVKRDFGFMG